MTAPLPRLTLQRARSTDQGTVGALLRSDGTRLAYSIELPWRENRRARSCIPPEALPAGTYLCRQRWSPRFGRVYEVTGVPARTAILLHAGNLAGDVERGLRSDVQGCIALGLQLGLFHGQLAVLVSRPAVSQLVREMRGEPFLLEVRPWASSTAS